jgi:hypothetical protein
MSAYNPKIDDFIKMARETYEKHKDEISVFVADYKTQDMYDRDGNVYQQLTPYLYIENR